MLFCGAHKRSIIIIIITSTKILPLGEHYNNQDEEEQKPKFVPESELESGKTPIGANTGPKGVIEDWRRYKQLERENREDAEKEKVELAKKLAMTCRTEREDEEAKEKERKMDEELEALLDDEFLAEYMQKRMKDMMQSAGKRPDFGALIHLHTAEEFLTAIDNEDKNVVIVASIDEDGVEGCEAMKGCLEIVAKDYPHTKFCRISASTAGLSKHFKSSGVPALQIYKAGELVASYVRVTDNLGVDFYAADVETFLIEHGVVTDKELVPKIIRDNSHKDDEDSD